MEFIERYQKYNASPESLRLLGAYLDKVFVGPRCVKLHVNSFCNFKCVFCWYHSKFVKKSKKKKALPFEKFKEIVDDSRIMGVEQISILGEGEPTLHPDIFKMIKYAKKSDIRVMIDTNLSIHPKHLKHMLEIDLIRVNLSAVSPKKHGFLQAGGSDKMFYRVLKNLKFLYEIKSKNKLKLNKPVVHIVYILNKYNFKDIDKMLKICSKFGIEYVEFKLMQANSDTSSLILSPKEMKELKLLIEKLLKAQREYKYRTNLYEVLDIIKRSINCDRKTVQFENACYNRFFYLNTLASNNIRCYTGWYYVHIDINGNVFPCCNHQQFLVGNIYRNRLIEIWNSDKFHQARIKYKYEINTDNDFWIECRYCPLIKFNKEIDKKLQRLRNKNV